MKVFNDKGYSRGVGVFIVHDGKLLLTHRVKGAQSGYWEVIAGHIEDNETPEQTAVRETKEEAGIEINIIRMLGVNVDHDHHFESTMFLAATDSTDIKNLDPSNHSELRWFDLKQLPEPMGSTTREGMKLIT